MAQNAEEFFGQSFNEIPKGGRPEENTEKGVVGKALDFFGIDFHSIGSQKKATNDTGIQPINRKFDEVFEKLIQAESRGRHTDDKGNLTTSPVGAQGITQLMPATAKKPGYGIEPVKDTSEAEYKRVGKEYLQALVGEFGGDYEKAVAAYNAGAKNVKRAVEKGGDNWKEHLPKKSETLPYLQRVLGDEAQFSGAGEKDLVQAQLEKSPKFTLGDAAKKGVLSNEGRKAFKDKVKEEYAAEVAKRSRKEQDTYFSNYIYFMQDKYPEEYRMISMLDNQLKGLSERQIAAVGLDVPITATNLMSETAGFVFNDNPDRVFIQGSGDTGTLVHEKEHLTTQREVEGARTLGQIGRFNEPVPQLLHSFITDESEWFKKNPVMRKVFTASNALNSDNEFLSNIAAYEASLPEGQSIYESEFATTLKKKFGDKRTKEVLDQAVALTLTNKGRIAESDFEFDTNKLDKDASYAKQVYQYLKKILGEQATSEPLGVSFAQATDRNLPPLSGEFKQPTAEQRIAKAKELGMNIAGALPVIGDVLSAKDIYEGVKEGSVSKTALGMVGLIPFVPASIRGISDFSGLINREAVTNFKEGMANVSELAPSYFKPVSDVKISAGPGGIVKVNPIKAPVLYRDTNPAGLDDLLRIDEGGDYHQIYVANKADIAIGQGSNSGIFVTFRDNALSGKENKKPGTGKIAGEEFVTDVIGPRAVLSFTVKDPKKLKLSAPAQRTIKKEFDSIVNDDGSMTFTRKIFNEALKEG